VAVNVQDKPYVIASAATNITWFILAVGATYASVFVFVQDPEFGWVIDHQPDIRVGYPDVFRIMLYGLSLT
jgi:hypothetical protein